MGSAEQTLCASCAFLKVQPDHWRTLCCGGGLYKFRNHGLGETQSSCSHGATLEEAASIKLRDQSFVYCVCHINLLCVKQRFCALRDCIGRGVPIKKKNYSQPILRFCWSALYMICASCAYEDRISIKYKQHVLIEVISNKCQTNSDVNI